ncbi:MAG: hypothetical protein C0483_19915 [Pirellula sp.]|nr:hypothetical protein [Pirellula sp.]
MPIGFPKLAERSWLGVFVAMASVFFVGCNRTPGYDANDIAEKLRKLGHSSMMPFDIREIKMVSSREVSKDQYVYDIELKGEFRGSIYLLIDGEHLAKAGIRSLSAPPLEFLQMKSPTQASELKKKLEEVAPGGSFYVTACRQGEPCVMTGQLFVQNSHKTMEKWMVTEFVMSGPEGVRGAGMKYQTRTGDWPTRPTFVPDNYSDWRQRMYLSIDGKGLSNSQTHVLSALPPGATAVDIDSSEFKDRMSALSKVWSEIDDATRKIIQTAKP